MDEAGYVPWKISQLAGNFLIQACAMALRPPQGAQAAQRPGLQSAGQSRRAEVACWQIGAL